MHQLCELMWSTCTHEYLVLADDMTRSIKDRAFTFESCIAENQGPRFIHVTLKLEPSGLNDDGDAMIIDEFVKSCIVTERTLLPKLPRLPDCDFVTADAPV